ncbi:MAG: hypothetical protein Q4P15_12325 [Propionibacteriaceae bacterium]|nr:hypothetical protein [Propionibacteriaceae bacterium]
MELTTKDASTRKRSVALVGLVLGVALLQRGLTVLMIAGGVGQDKLVSSLMAYDSLWYGRVVEHGYQLAGEAGLKISSLAFFPLFPGMAKALTLVTGASTSTALLALAFVGSVLAAWPIFAIGRHLYSARVGLVLTLLWGASPQSFVLVMGYPEGWFTAATAWALLFMMQRRPLPAAVAVTMAGLLRPSAVPLVAVMVVWCFLQWRRDPLRRLRWPAAAMLAPVGLASFVAYTAWRMDDLFGYFAVQKQWNLQMGGPWAFWEQITEQLRSSNALLISVDLYVPIILGYVVLLVLLMGWWRKTDHGWMVLYTLLASLLILSRSTYFWSEPRQFLPLFPLLIPLATIRTSAWAWGAVIVGLTMATGAFGGAFLAAMQYSP